MRQAKVRHLKWLPCWHVHSRVASTYSSGCQFKPGRRWVQLTSQNILFRPCSSACCFIHHRCQTPGPQSLPLRTLTETARQPATPPYPSQFCTTVMNWGPGAAAVGLLVLLFGGDLLGILRPQGSEVSSDARHSAKHFFMRTRLLHSEQ